MMPSLLTYGGLLHDPGYAGQAVDMNFDKWYNLINSQATAIQFGYAVARDVADGTCKAPSADSDVIIGISGRWAIKASPGYGQTSANVVQFAQYDQVPVMRDGMIYAVPVENVQRGDRVVSLTAQNGALGGESGNVGGSDATLAPAKAATGTITLAVNPTAGDTVTINGTAVTFVAALTSGIQVLIGATAAATATALAAVLSASADAQLVKFKYVDLGDGIVELTAVTAGTGGNALTLATSNAVAVVLSGATLAGGAAATGGAGRAPVPNAVWETTTAAGSLGVVYINN
jgi:hypothetical protein